MPHLLIERLREFPTLGSFTFPFNRKEYPTGAFVLEVLDIIAGVLFVIGSICFLPPYSDDIDVFLAGCGLFVVGGIFYLVVCACSFFEALFLKGLATLEASENALYLVGSWLFLVGTFLYWPAEAHYRHIETFKDMTLGAYFNLFDPEFEGTLFFIIGSVMFAFGAFFNALNQREFDEFTSKLLSAITSLYLGGSLLFAMGSVAFLPNMGCGKQMQILGAWGFIIGSVLYLIGGCLSLWRTTWITRHPELEVLKSGP
mmetsp:Transcript_41508/g.72931  ORF Transcript_41508/g.72931 Transcript_41508/m.72931 type:complete len:257 (-) Transcript_41508:96-866(-)